MNPLNLIYQATRDLAGWRKTENSLLLLVWLTVTTTVFFFSQHTASAVNRTWDGGGPNNLWSEPLNWSGDVVPTSDDIAVFDAASGNSTIDAAFAGSVAGIQINAGFTGTITQAAGVILTIGTSGFSQASGTFTGSDGGVIVGGPFTLNGGTFNAPSGSLQLKRDFTVAASTTFVANGGTLVFNGVFNQAINGPSTLTLNNMTLDKPGSILFFNSGATNLVITGTLTLTNGVLQDNTGVSIFNAQGAVTFVPGFDGGIGPLFISGAAVRTITFPVGAAVPRLTVNAPNVTLNTSGAGAISFDQPFAVQSCSSFTNGAVSFVFSQPFTFGTNTNFAPGSGDVTFSSEYTQTGGTFSPGAGALNFNGAFTLNGGTFNAPNGSLLLKSNLTVDASATFVANSGTLVFNGVLNQQINGTSTLTVNNLTLDKPGSTLFFNSGATTIVVTGTLTLTNGVLQDNTGVSSVNAQGAVTFVPGFDGGIGPLLISGAAARTITFPVGAAVPRLTVNAPNVTLNTSGAGAINFDQPFAVQSCSSFTNGAVSFVFSQPFTFGTNTNFAPGSGDVTFSSDYTQTGGTFSPGAGALNFNGAFTLNGGTFNAPNGSLQFKLSFTIDASATFVANGGTLVFNGVFNQGINGTSTLTVNNLTLDKPGSTLFFDSGATTIVVTGTLTLTNGVLQDNTNVSSVNAQGSISIATAFDGGNARLSFTGSANQIFTNNGGLNPTGTWTIDKTSGSITATTSIVLSTSQPLNITNGTLYLDNNSNLTCGALTVGPGGRLVSDTATTITLGGAVSNSGRIDLQGGGVGCPQADDIRIRSSVEGTQRNWSVLGQGAFRLVDVDVKDMSGTAPITVFSGTGASGANNGANWTFDDSCPDGLSIAPLVANVTIGNSQQFTAGSDFPPYSFSIVSDPAHGSINPSTGLYMSSSIGTDTVRVNDGFGNVADATVNVFDIPDHLAFITQPTNTTAGQSISQSLQVVIQDQYNNTVGSAFNSITIEIGNNPGCPASCGILFGTLTVNAVNGIASFNNLSIQRAAAGYTLQANSSGLTSATSVAFNVTAAAAARVSFVTQPTNTNALAAMTPSVQIAIQDAFGNTVTGATGTVSLSIQNNPGNDQFFGTRFASPVNGVATFSNLVSNAPANGYTLLAHRSDLTDAISDPFNIIRPIWLVTNTSNSGSGSLKQAILDANLVTGSDTINFSIAGTAPFSIHPVGNLPEITGPVILDATTQPGYAGTPIIELRGSSASSLGGPGFRVSGGSSTIKGFAINTFHTGIVLVSNGGNTIQANHIGTDVTGNSALGNNNGIVVYSAGNQIGGTTPASRNTISGNLISGIWLSDSNSTIIKGNHIGLNSAGDTGIPNPTAIVVSGNTSNSIIGGTQAGEANLINYSSRGIHFKSVGTSVGNTIRGNLIRLLHFHTAIDLDPDSRTPNDPGDADTGGNNRQNYPVISSATVSNNTTTVQGTLNSSPSSSFIVDFYSYNLNPSDGKYLPTYQGSMNVLTNASGIASFQFALPQLPTSHGIAATTTDAQGNTSELSDPRIVSPATVSISGRVVSGSGTPLKNVMMKLTGGQLSSTATNSNGDYTFNLPSSVTYVVTPTLVNYTFVPTSRTYSNITTNQPNQNYVGTKISSRIAGLLTQVTPFGSQPMVGVMVTVSGPTTRTTVANGAYLFNSLPVGQYTVTPERSGIVFSPSSFIVNLGVADQVINFTGQGGTPLPGRFVFGIGNGFGQPRSMNADGTSLVQLAHQSAPPPHGARNPFRDTAFLSRDGKLLVGPENLQSILSVSNADGSNHRRLSTGVAQDNQYNYSFSPDGTMVACTVGEFIRIVNVNGSGHTTLSLPPYLAFKASPTWLSNSRIAFSATESGINRLQVFAVNIDSTGFVQITSGAPDKFYPVASPDGSKIAFATQGALHTMNVDGSGDTVINSALADQFRFAWSPDGTKLCFSKVRTTQPTTYDFVAVNSSDGGGLRVILNREVFGPSWGPLYEFATPTGSNVSVDTGFNSIVFGGVTSPGTTTVTQIPFNYNAPLPGNFQLLGGGIGYEISTTASYTPPIAVCLVVPSTVAPTSEAFSFLFLMHSENGVFVDTTISRNFSTRTICGSVNSLSPFALAEEVSAKLPSIWGIVQDVDGNPLPDVSVQLTGTENRTTQTDALGNFNFVNLTQDGNYNVQPKMPGYLFTEYSQDFLTLSGENTVAFTGTYSTFSIGGKALDENGNVVSGVDISLNGSTTATTDKNGDYIFTDLPADSSFFLRPFKDGFGFSPVIQVIDPLTSDQTEVDFVLGPPACAFGTSTASRFFLMNGGSGSVNVVTGSSCSWTAVASDSWITIVSADTGTGNGVVDFEVRENFTNSARQATINISGQLVTIVQDGGLGDDCGYSISPGFQSFSAAGGGGVINVNAEDRCAWQAVSSAPWVTITLNDVGIGNGSVSYSVAANPGPGGRAATITLGGKVFAVKQKGP